MPESKIPEDAPEKQVAEQDQRNEDEIYEEYVPSDEYFSGLAADRAMIRTLVNFIGMSLEATEPDHPRVKLARDWALVAAYERVARACSSDLPNFDDETLFPIEETDSE